jgi:hypothetical protein
MNFPHTMTPVSPCNVRLAASAQSLHLVASVWGLRLLAFVRDQIGGALSYAAVPRCGLGPLPPLCRYAECTADLIFQAWRVLYSRRSNAASPYPSVS